MAAMQLASHRSGVNDSPEGQTHAHTQREKLEQQFNNQWFLISVFYLY